QGNHILTWPSERWDVKGGCSAGDSSKAGNTATIWDVTTGLQLLTLQHDAPITSAAFDPSGRLIVTTSQAPCTRLWSAENGELLATLRGHGDKVWSAQFSADGTQIVTVSEDQTARVWHGEPELSPTILAGSDSGIQAWGVSRDGKRIIAGSRT